MKNAFFYLIRTFRSFKRFDILFTYFIYYFNVKEYTNILFKYIITKSFKYFRNTLLIIF